MKRTFMFIISVLAIALTVPWGQRVDAQPEWGLPDPEPMEGLEGMMEDILIEQGPGFGEMSMMEHMQREHGEHMQREHGEIPPPLFERLKLTDEQQAKLKELRFGFAKEMARLQADLQVAQLELMATLDQPNPKPEEARAKAAKVSEAEAAILQRSVAFQVGMKTILTPDQQKILRQERRMRFIGPGPRPERPFGRPFLRRWRPWDGPQPEIRPRPDR